MAVHAGAMASSKVLVLVGAGVAGSIILRNGRLSDVLAQLQELMKNANDGDASMGHYDVNLLAAQIRHLAQEVRELTLSKPVTILTGNSSSRNLASFILPAAAIGAAGCCYMWWKGLSLSDVMFVTKRNMANAVESVSKQLEHVSTALAATKKHLTQRLENLDGKVDEQRELSKAIMNEVNGVKTDLSQIGTDIELIQSMITGLEGKIDLLENKQDVSNAGIWYLCQAAGNIKDGINSKIFQEASEKLKLTHRMPALEDQSLKGLRFFADDNRDRELASSEPSQKDDETPLKTSVLRRAALHRTSNISFRTAGLAL